MPFLFIRNDITKVHADAIVNTANRYLQEGSGTSRAIYLAAGEEKLQEACRKIGSCELGKAVMTEGFALPAKYIIHTVGPVWQNGTYEEDEFLYSAYLESMKLAGARNLKSIAFPLISSGNYGYPKERALKIAVSAVSDFLMEHEMLVYLVLYDEKSLAVSRKLFDSIEEYIDEHYIAENNEEYSGKRDTFRFRDLLKRGGGNKKTKPDAEANRYGADVMSSPETVFQVPFIAAEPQAIPAKEKTRMLDDIMRHMGESFSQMLFRLIDERGLTDPEVYHRANIDRRHFSKIRTNPNYTPTKKTVLALAVALELSIDEAKDLLRTVGYSFSDCSRFDVILSFFLEKKIYDIYEINEFLFYYGQPVLGGF